jgi:hypothetical protein
MARVFTQRLAVHRLARLINTLFILLDDHRRQKRGFSPRQDKSGGILYG